MAKRDGGPAFPNAPYMDGDGPDLPGQDGMFLRDYFAAQALNGIMASDLAPPLRRIKGTDVQGFPELVARSSYRLADAMIEERKK